MIAREEGAARHRRRCARAGPPQRGSSAVVVLHEDLPEGLGPRSEDVAWPVRVDVLQWLHGLIAGVGDSRRGPRGVFAQPDRAAVAVSPVFVHQASQRLITRSADLSPTSLSCRRGCWPSRSVRSETEPGRRIGDERTTGTSAVGSARETRLIMLLIRCCAAYEDYRQSQAHGLF